MRISDWSSDVCSSDLRRAWKHELMAAVDARVHAAPVAAPGPDRWNAVNAKDDAYRRVTASGTFRHDRETLVQAVTERGARSEEGRVGKARVRTCSCRWSPYH